MHSLHFSIKELHQYPVGLNKDYLLTPEAFPNMLDLTNVERTFLAENKQYWAAAAQANFNKYRSLQATIKSVYDEKVKQGCEFSASQVDYINELQQKKSDAIECFKKANSHRKTGFGVIANNDNKEILRLKTFYHKLWAFITNNQENTVFKNNVAEAALNIVRKRYYFDAEECDFGMGNHKFIKTIFADINFWDHSAREMSGFMFHTEMVSEKLSQLISGKYITPKYHA